MIRKLTTAGIALTLGVMWTWGPALAQTTTGEKAESKTERAKDKAVEMKDTVKEKAHDAKEKVKEKTTELKDKVKGKMDRAERKAEHKAEHRDVKAMQQALKDKGHNPGPIDGVMGPRTKTALRDYQRKEGLKVTGRWDDETAAKLGVRMSARDKETVPAASPAAPSASSPQPTPSTPAGTSTAPPATPEDKTAPPQKRSSP